VVVSDCCSNSISSISIRNSSITAVEVVVVGGGGGGGVVVLVVVAAEKVTALG